jgi:hypothetical protein
MRLQRKLVRAPRSQQIPDADVTIDRFSYALVFLALWLAIGGAIWAH